MTADISSTDRFKVSEMVLSQEVKGETVLLDLASENYFGLDPIGTKVWGMLADSKSIGEILETLLQSYEVEPVQLQSDIKELMLSLLDAGIVSRLKELPLEQ